MAGVSVPDPPARPLAASVLGVAIIAITGMQLMSTLDGTIVIVALPRMQAELGLSDAGKSWVITAYVLTFGGLLLLGGRVGDAIGHKRAFISGVGVFTIASMACGLATDGPLLIAARAVQGIGAAVAAPTGLALIATTYAAGTARNRAMAMSAAMQGIGAARVVLGAPEPGQHVIPAPALVAKGAPVLVVIRLAAHVKHAVDRAGATEHPTAGLVEYAPSQRRLRCRGVHPVVAWIAKELGVTDGNMDPRAAVLAPRFEQQHAVATRFAQTRRQHTTGGTAAHHNKIEFTVLHRISPVLHRAHCPRIAKSSGAL